jgi:uncharacterized protein (UPF0335 family)
MGSEVVPIKVLDLPLPEQGSLDKALKTALKSFRAELTIYKKIEIAIERRAILELNILDLTENIKIAMANMEIIKEEFADSVKIVYNELLSSPAYTKIVEQFSKLRHGPKDVEIRLRMAVEEELARLCAPMRSEADGRRHDLAMQILHLRDKIEVLEKEHAAITAEIEGYQAKLQ